MKLRLYIPVIIIAALSVLSGCYTVIEHPDVQGKDENGYAYNSKVYFYDDCGSCHTDMDHSRQLTQSEHLSMFKAHGNAAYDNGYYSDQSYSDQYYSTQYYGDYGYYYNTPWWYTVTPPEQVTKTRDAQNQGIKYNGRSRKETGDRQRGDDHGTSTAATTSGGGSSPGVSSPTVSRPSSSGGSTSSSSTVSSSSSDQNRNETRSSSDNRSSNDQPRSRSNDGGRSSNSGRR